MTSFFIGIIKSFKKTELRVKGGTGHWAVYYTSPESFILTFSYSLASKLLGLLLNFDLFPMLSVQMLQPLIVIYRSGNFVYHHGGFRL